MLNGQCEYDGDLAYVYTKIDVFFIRTAEIGGLIG